MANNEDVTVKIKAKDEASAALKGVGANVSSLGSTLKKLAGAFVALQAVRATFGFLKESLEGAVQEREGIARLDAALRKVGTSYAANEKTIESLAATQQRFTKYGDDATRDVLARLVNLTGDYDVALRATALAQDMATGAQMDAGAAADALGRALGGNVIALGRMNPRLKEAAEGLDKNATAAERARVILGAVEEVYGGMARNVDPLAQTLDRIKNDWGDLKETLGDVATGADRSAGSLGRVAEIIEGLTRYIAENKEQWRQWVAGGLSVALKAMLFTVEALGMMVEWVNRLQMTQNRLSDAMNTVATKASIKWGSAWEKVLHRFDTVPEALAARAKSLRQEIDQAWAEDNTALARQLEEQLGDLERLRERWAITRGELALERGDISASRAQMENFASNVAALVEEATAKGATKGLEQAAVMWAEGPGAKEPAGGWRAPMVLPAGPKPKLTGGGGATGKPAKTLDEEIADILGKGTLGPNFYDRYEEIARRIEGIGAAAHQAAADVKDSGLAALMLAVAAETERIQEEGKMLFAGTPERLDALAAQLERIKTLGAEFAEVRTEATKTASAMKGNTFLTTLQGMYLAGGKDIAEKLRALGDQAAYWMNNLERPGAAENLERIKKEMAGLTAAGNNVTAFADRLRGAIDTGIVQAFDALAQAAGDAFTAMALGADDAGRQFMGAMLSAIARVAAALASLFMGEYIGSRGLDFPKLAASLALYALATSLSVASGYITGKASGGGRGRTQGAASGFSAASQQSQAAQKEGRSVMINVNYGGSQPLITEQNIAKAVADALTEAERAGHRRLPIPAGAR